MRQVLENQWLSVIFLPNLAVSSQD